MLYLISLLSFFLPTQLGLHFDILQSTVYGFQIDYLIPTLYLTDIIIFLIIFLGLRKIKIRLWIVCFFVIFASFNIYISSYFIPTIYKWLKVTEMVLLGLVIINTKKFDVFKHFVRPLSYSMIIINILAILQYFNKSSIGGIFYYLGERSFLFSDPNVSPFPYSTFSHPNSFAGFLLVFGIFLIQFKNKFNKKYFWLLLSLIGINLIITNSLNVYIAIAVLVLLRVPKIYNSSFLFINFSERFITHRIELIKASWVMIKENFLFGVGLNNFIPNLPKVTNSFLNAWELQPVHNIFLLIFSETGVFGLIAFCFLIFFSFSLATSHYALITILLTGLSDHYWLTLQQNILLLTYTLAIGYAKK